MDLTQTEAYKWVFLHTSKCPAIIGSVIEEFSNSITGKTIKRFIFCNSFDRITSPILNLSERGAIASNLR
jgi:hypothetical protein